MKKTYKIEVDCANCANKMEDAARNISGCEECVLNISAMLEMSSPAVSHHLRPLKNSGLIVSRREGKEVYSP